MNNDKTIKNKDKTVKNKILLVDDEIDTCLTFKNMLEEMDLILMHTINL
jgi:hypothetical protein